jgi:ParB family chromosome partitioning protein
MSAKAKVEAADADSVGTSANPKPRKAKTSQTSVVSISMKDIWEEENTRDPGWEKKVSDLQALIKAQGLLQPVGVAERGGPNGEPFQLVFGSRRREACKRLNWSRIDAKVAPKKASNIDLFFWKLGENSGRKDLSPMEEARAFHKVIDKYSIAAKDLARRLGKTDGYVSQRLALLKLPEEVQEAVEEGRITATHAREIARVTDEKDQKRLLKKAEKMPVTDFKEHVDDLDGGKKKNSNRGRKAREKPEATEVDAVGEKVGVRSEKEAVKMLGTLDTRMKSVSQKDSVEAKLQQEYYKGCIRGIMWARKMGGASKLV